MSIRSGVLFCLAGLVGTLAVFPVLGQRPLPEDARKQNPSHEAIPSLIGDPKLLQELLNDRFRKAQDLADLKKLFDDPSIRDLLLDVAKNPDKFGVKDQIDKLKQQKPDVNDPAWRDLLGKVLDAKGDLKTPDGKPISPQQLDGWKKLIDRTTDLKPDPNSVTPKPPDVGKNTPTPPMPKPPEGNPPSMNPPTPPPMQQPPRPPPKKQASNDRFNKLLLDAVENFKKSPSAFKDSPAWRQFMRDAGRTLTGDNDKGFGLSDKAGEWASKFPALSELVPPDRLPRPNIDSSWLKNLPEWKFNPGQPGGQGNWGAPSISGPSAGAGGETWAALLWLVLGVAVVVVVVLMLRWNKAREQAKPTEAWRLGPWPVDPKAVRTREDVVKAFEHLSLLRLGRAARAWHHLRIADHLTGPHVGSVDRVVEVYEKARYTPPKETLTEADLAVVRRDLSDLAGVSAS